MYKYNDWIIKDFFMQVSTELRYVGLRATSAYRVWSLQAYPLRRYGWFSVTAYIRLVTLTFDLSRPLRMFMMWIVCVPSLKWVGLSVRKIWRHQTAWGPWPLIFWPLNCVTGHPCQHALTYCKFSASILDLGSCTERQTDRQADGWRPSTHNARTQVTAA